jgi:DNA-directed RNA polymerase subunit M/transcription elongation factor TFIIS
MDFEQKLEMEYAKISNISFDGILWDNVFFSKIRDKIEEENNFIENPIVDIEEGIIQCNKCKSYKTFSYQKQVRSSDEGFTLFVSCVDCNASWVEN